eukprot:CAMPEP_0179311040 /NCGR_PEP_ID=MMETSP0797-20121207/52479_1 /TAXON_ID=47934 /ORGANISM="Dinophysis acuminata, Strain DAEP01" /LENGTH=38 /DNA_ID= /DNA_START= /DNA_END= /DNA_ORIENTATION=
MSASFTEGNVEWLSKPLNITFGFSNDLPASGDSFFEKT